MCKKESWGAISISIAPLQRDYSGALPIPVQIKGKFLDEHKKCLSICLQVCLIDWVCPSVCVLLVHVSVFVSVCMSVYACIMYMYVRVCICPICVVHACMCISVFVCRLVLTITPNRTQIVLSDVVCIRRV